LNLRAAQGQYVTSRWLPSDDLAPLVLYYWFVRWDRTGQDPFEQEVLTQPFPNLVFELDGTTGATASRLVGPKTTRFTRRLEGRGRVVGVAFQPGALFPWLRIPLARLTDKVFPLEEVLEARGAALERAVLHPGDDRSSAEAIERFLRGAGVVHDESVALVKDLMARISAEPSITKVEDLLPLYGIGMRKLQRLFNQYVGVSPKWVIRRFRLIEAARRLDAGELPSLADLATSLGYFDQAHFNRDFKALVGRTPAAYRKSASSRRAANP
jgi:AraC-like DNA-binding protein